MKKNTSPDSHSNEFTRSELRFLKTLNSPIKIQRYLDSVPYHIGNTSWSPRRVIAEKTAHCLEGAIFAAAALRVNGYPPLIVDLEAEQDTDHVIAVFQERGHWGSIAISNFSGLRFREAVYRSLRELAMSYFADYFNLRGDLSLRRFSQPVNLSRFDRRKWMTSPDDIWFIAEHLVDIKHTVLIDQSTAKRLSRVDTRSLKAAKQGYRTQ